MASGTTGNGINGAIAAVSRTARRRSHTARWRLEHRFHMPPSAGSGVYVRIAYQRVALPAFTVNVNVETLLGPSGEPTLSQKGET